MFLCLFRVLEHSLQITVVSYIMEWHAQCFRLDGMCSFVSLDGISWVSFSSFHFFASMLYINISMYKQYMYMPYIYTHVHVHLYT